MTKIKMTVTIIENVPFGPSKVAILAQFDPAPVVKISVMPTVTVTAAVTDGHGCDAGDREGPPADPIQRPAMVLRGLGLSGARSALGSSAAGSVKST